MTEVIPPEIVDEPKAPDEGGESDGGGKGGESGKEPDKSKDNEFDENSIDPEVLNYKPETPKEDLEDGEDPEDRARIKKIIERELGGDIQSIKRQVAVDGFFNANPEMGKYKGAAMKYLNHPSYSGLPIHNIVAIVASKDMQKIGAAKERAAQEKVNETRSPGTTVRTPAGGSVDWKNASKADFESQKAKVLGRVGN